MKVGPFLLTLLFSVLTSVAIGQKFGYINSATLLTELSSVSSANSTLETYQNQLMAKGQSMYKALEEQYNAYVVEANSGTLSKVDMQEREVAIQQKREALGKYEQEVQTKIMTKREELFTPILNKVDNAIKAVGQENNFTFIFDSSGGQVLFAEDAQDITTLVKAKLN